METMRTHLAILSLSCRKKHLMLFKKLLFALLALATFATTATAQSEKTTQGYATYYGSKWHGRRAADGSVFSNDSLTCAHKTLPFGTVLHVRNPKNGKEVVVKVTDRGPFRRNTLIDLSQAAAKEIDMLRSGVVMVEVTPLPSLGKDGSAPLSNPIPELELLDPATGKFYTMTQWQQRQERQREMAEARSKASSRRLAAQKQPRYRVGKAKATAQAKKKK